MDALPIQQTCVSRLMLVPSALSDLLVFLPSVDTFPQQRLALMRLADSLEKQLIQLVRVHRVDERSHPEVVQSFNITRFPAFVLVRQGVELWQQEGIVEEEVLIQIAHRLIADPKSTRS